MTDGVLLAEIADYPVPLMNTPNLDEAHEGAA